MDVLLTGASGFVGRRLAARLAARGDRVVGTTVEPQDSSPDCELVEVDLRDPRALAVVAERLEPDVIVHLAGLSHVGDSWHSPGLYFQVNVLGTEQVLAAFPGRRVLLASSAEVYGRVPEDEQPVRETRTPAPENPYALTKAAAERLALGAGGVVLRFFSFVGAGQPRRFALPDFAAQLAAGDSGRRQRLAVGNLAARRAFLHVEDGVDGIVTAIERGSEGEIYNLGGERAVSIREALDELIALTGREVEVEVEESRLRPVDIPLLAADTGRLRGLGWEPRRTLAAALSEIWDEARRESGARG